MKKIGEALLLTVYAVSPLLGAFFFVGGLGGYFWGHRELNALWYVIAYSCIAQWVFFVFGVFVAKKFNKRSFSKAIRKITIILFIVLFLLPTVISFVNGKTTLFIVIPLLLFCFTPHVSFAVWNKNRSKKLPWILTVVACSVVSGGLFFFSHVLLT